MSQPRQLSYCTNIHPGERWDDVMVNLEQHALAVKQAVSPHHSFPLGLRLSAQAAHELDDAAIGRFRDWCGQHGCHVMTLNGFPYGQFHGVAVKRAVYQPDWRDRARVSYTKRLADVLAHWVPDGASSSISTVPVAFRDRFQCHHWPLVRANLLDALTHLARLHQRGGPLIRLAIEPEPHCVLERSIEVVAFFDRMRLPAELAPYLGICFDCCHQAVQFEDPAECLDLLARADIALVKVQLSSALRVRGPAIAQLLEFDEPTYLHQAVVRTADGALLRFADLPDLGRWLARGQPADECRVHFHVPIFLDRLGRIDTTRFFLEDCIRRLDPGIPMEVETYSFAALPPALQLGSVGDSIVREINWVKELLDAPNRRA